MNLTRESTPEEVRDAWATALKSDEYEQGSRTLGQVSGTGVKHCCLGVLCELAVQAGMLSKRIDGYSVVYVTPTDEDDEGERHIHGRDYVAMPPTSVWQWAGLASKEHVRQYSTANDVAHRPFADIALAVRANDLKAMPAKADGIDVAAAYTNW